MGGSGTETRCEIRVVQAVHRNRRVCRWPACRNPISTGCANSDWRILGGPGKMGDWQLDPSRLSGGCAMDKSPKITAEELTKRLLEESPGAERIVAAINAAPDGNWIGASEEQVQDVEDEFVRAAFEAALQQKAEAAEAAFPPSAGREGKEAQQ